MIMKTMSRVLDFFFSVTVKSQTYRNGLYLLLAFPLGIAYGVFLMMGWFLGYGLVSAGWLSLSPDMLSNIKILAVIVGGILVWILVVASCGIPAWFEKRLADWLLGTNFHASSRPSSPVRSFWVRIWAYLTDLATWKSVIFIALKLPLGIIFFTVVIGLLSAASGLFLAPLAHLVGFRSFIIGPWRIDTWSETFIASAIGVFAVPLSLHMLNGLAFASKWFAIAMLEDHPRGKPS